MTEVLLVDDDPDMRRMLAFELAAEGFVVREAVDGVDALEALAGRPADAVVLDLMMPNLDGFATLEAIRADRALDGIKVVILSSKGDAAILTRCFELRADAHLTKPVDPVVVSKKLQSLLAFHPARP